MKTKKTVLIIDDEIDFCLLMQFYLSKKNCEVTYCNELQEGLKNIELLRPDIIIADAHMSDDAQEKIETKLKQIEGLSPNLFLLKASKNNNSTQARKNEDSSHTTIFNDFKKLIDYIKDKFNL